MKTALTVALSGIVCLVLIGVGALKMYQGYNELFGSDVTSQANELIDRGNAAIVEANTLTTDAAPRYSELFTRVDEVGFPDGRAEVAEFAREVANAFDAAAKKFHESADLFTEACALDIAEELREYLKLKAESSNKLAETKEHARDCALLLVDESITTVDQLLAGIEACNAKINSAFEESQKLDTQADTVAAENPGVIIQ